MHGDHSGGNEHIAKPGAAILGTMVYFPNAKVTAEFDAKVTGATPQTADRFVTQLYQELKTAR